MAEYNEKQLVLSKSQHDYLEARYDYDDFVLVSDIESITPADVRPVVRGEWLKSPECPEEYDICSVCGLNDKHRIRGNAEHPALESVPPFCKWCGADLRGGDAE